MTRAHEIRKPYNGQAIETDHAAALGHLRSHIARCLDVGEIVPCVGFFELWISDDAGDQEVAANACLDCPIFTRCRDHIADYPEPAAVWAGLTPSERTSR